MADHPEEVMVIYNKIVMSIPKSQLLRRLGSKRRLCTHHPREKISMVCTMCGGKSVCVRCMSTSHARHKFMEIDDYSNTKKIALSNVVKEGDPKKAELEEKLLKLHLCREENKRSIEDAIKDIERRGELLKNQIDKITRDFVQQVRSIEKRNEDLIRKLEIKMQNRVTEMNLNVEKGKNILESGNYENFHAIEKTLRALYRKPYETMVLLQTPNLSIAIQEPNDISSLFGTLKTKSWKFQTASDVDPDTATEISSRSVNIGHGRPSEISILATFQYPPHITGIRTLCAVDDFTAWLVYNESNSAQLTTITGDIKITASVEAYIYIVDIVCTTDKYKTAIICCSDGSIRQIMPYGKVQTLFRVEGSIGTSLCEGNSPNSIIVCHDDGKLAMYNRKGTVLRVIDKDAEGRKLFSMPTRVRSNKMTGDLAVVEDSLPRSVIIVDKRFNVLCRYHGTFSFRGDSAPAGNLDNAVKKFIPIGICFDVRHHLVIADKGSKSVILIDRFGRTTMSLWTDNNLPYSLGVQPNGDLWAGFSDTGKVKVLRYTK